VNPYTKAILSLIRMISAGLMVTSLVYLSSCVFFAVGRKESGEGFLPLALKSAPFVLGLVLWFKAYAISRKLTEDFDD
jgi:hypothetical protein